MTRPGAGTLALAVAALLAFGACSNEQDPGVDSPSSTSTSKGTPNTLGPCPPGGPDATTPPAGCLDPEGNVLGTQ